MQYTTRRVSNTLDAVLRRWAREQGKSLNEVAIEAMARGSGLTGRTVRQRDLHDIAGTWREDRALIAPARRMKRSRRSCGGDARTRHQSLRGSVSRERQTVEIVEAADAIWLPFVVMGEFRAGFAAGSQGPRNEAVLQRFLLKPGSESFTPTSRQPTITLRFTGDCGNRERPSRPTTCGSQPSSFNIRSPCTTATATSTPFHSFCEWMRRPALLNLKQSALAAKSPFGSRRLQRTEVCASLRGINSRVSRRAGLARSAPAFHGKSAKTPFAGAHSRCDRVRWRCR